MNDDVLDEIRSLITLSSLAGTHARRIPCPFHNGSGNDMVLYHDNNRWRCFSACDDGHTHDIFDWVMHRDGCDFPTAAKYLADEAGISTKPNQERVDILTDAQLVYHKNLMNTPAARAYLNARGFSDEHMFIQQFGWADKRMYPLEDPGKLRSVGLADYGDHGLYPWFRTRVIFPIYDSRKVQINMQGRLIEHLAYNGGGGAPKYLALPNEVELKGRPIDKCLGGEEVLGDHATKFVILAEGVPDRETFFAWRIPSVNLFGHMGLENHAYKFKGLQQVYTVLDPDTASQSKIHSSLYKLAIKIPDVDIRNIVLDTNGMDINSWAMHGKPAGQFLNPHDDEAKIEAFRLMVAKAKPVVQELIDTWADKPHLIQLLAQLIAVIPDRERWTRYLADALSESYKSVDFLVRVLTPEAKQ